jgi:hypothetical protein
MTSREEDEGFRGDVHRAIHVVEEADGVGISSLQTTYDRTWLAIANPLVSCVVEPSRAIGFLTWFALC